MSEEARPHESPVVPIPLSADDKIQFHCHKDIACFNACCKSIDITLMPYDIVRLKKRFSMTSSEFLAQYTALYEMDAQGMPGVKLRTVGDTTVCPFLVESGCSVYEDRPTACRYYALGLMSMRREDEYHDEDVYFIVKEDHCLGHQEPRTLTAQEYRQEQGIEIYDEINHEWRQIVLKKRSAGSAVGKPPLRSFQLFFLASYNLDSFRDFVQSQGFLDIYDLDEDTVQMLKTDEVALLKFGSRFLKQVLFGEPSIPLKADAQEKRAKHKESAEQLR